MAKIKVVALLKSLTPDEMRLLDKFVKSPIHNKHNQVIQLFSHIRKNIHQPAEKIYSEKLFGKLFPGEQLNLKKLHHVSSYLFKTVEEFLAWNEWKHNSTAQGLELLKAYRRLNQPHFFYKAFNQTIEKQSGVDIRDSNYFHQLFELENLRFSQMRVDSKNKNFYLQELSDAQDEAFIIQKLKTACILLSNQGVTKITYDLGLIPLIQSYVENKNYLQNPTLAIYYYASKVLSNFNDNDSFHQLKELLLKYRERFHTQELYDIHIFAINYCIRRLNTGDQKFMREVFDIYQSGIYSGIFLDQGKLAPRTYSNIVMSGLRLGEYDEVEKFIYSYKGKLPEKQREGFFNYNLAHLFYEKKNYKKAMPLLLQIETYDVLHTCTSKTLLAKMYFELNESESLSNLIQSFKIFLKRKKLLGYHRELYLNFISFLIKLINANKLELLNNISEEIKNTKVLAERGWLLKQVEKKQKSYI